MQFYKQLELKDKKDCWKQKERFFAHGKKKMLMIYFNMPVIHRLLRLQVSQLHTNVENSIEIVKSVLSTSETYSVVLKEAMQPAGSIGLKISPASCIRDS